MKNGFQIINDATNFIEDMKKSIRDSLRKAPFPEVQADWAGDINLGNDETGAPNPFGFTDEYAKNILVIGKPGQGKSYLIIYTTIQEWERGKIIIFIETKKKVFTNTLLQIIDNILSLSYEDGSIKINFLEAPTGVPQTEWDQTWSSIFNQTQDLPQASGTSHFISSNRQELRDLVGDKRPNLLDLRDFIENKKIGRMSPDFRYAEVADNRLSDISKMLKPSIDVSEGYNFRQLIESPFIKVLQCSDRPDLFNLEATDFIMRTLKYQESLRSDERREVVIVLDEAHHLAGPEKEAVARVGGLSNLFSYMSHGREYKVSFRIISQDIKRIHPSIPSLSHVIVMFSSDGETYQRLGVNILGLDYDQKAYLFERGLAPRQFIAKIDSAPGVLLKTPDISHMFRNIDFVKAKERNQAHLEEFKFKPRDPEIMRLILAQSDKRDDNQKLFLMQLCRKHDAFKTEHKKDLGWTNARFDKEVKRAEALGLLKSVEIYLGTPGRQPEVLEFTDKGRELALQLGLKIPRQMRGGAAHNLYIKRVSTCLSGEGYEMRSEYALSAPPIFIDLYGRKGNAKIAIEVELSDWQHGFERIKGLIEANVMDEIWLMSDKPEVVNKIKRQLEIDKLYTNRVTVMAVQEFFRQRRKM